MPSSSTVSSDPTLLNRSRVASSPRCRLYSARMGTNACENAPSANIRRSMLGSRNAASNASICMPAPKATALRLSRTSPEMRDSSVMALTVDSARSRFIAGRGDRKRTAKGMARRTSGGRQMRGRVAAKGKNDYYARSFFVSPENPRKSIYGEYRASEETCPAIGRDTQAQRQSEVGAAQRRTQRQEGHRRRRQGGRAEGVPGAAGCNRPHRRQENRAQEHGLAQQAPPRARAQGHALAVVCVPAESALAA